MVSCYPRPDVSKRKPFEGHRRQTGRQSIGSPQGLASSLEEEISQSTPNRRDILSDLLKENRNIPGRA
jgi:hypothetical protein